MPCVQEGRVVVEGVWPGWRADGRDERSCRILEADSSASTKGEVEFEALFSRRNMCSTMDET
jgi:hypothetical protein